MSTDNSLKLLTKKQFQDLFDGLAEKLESRLAHIKDSKGPAKPPHINDMQLAAEIGEPSPIALFIGSTRVICRELLTPAADTDTNESIVKKADEQARTTMMLNAARLRLSRLKPTAKESAELRELEKVCTDEEFRDLPGAQALLQLATVSNVPDAIAQVANQNYVQATAQQILSRVMGRTIDGAPAAQQPTEDDWNSFSEDATRLLTSKEPDKHLCGCSLIYSYWLDEAGVHFALERVADRVENGVVANTEALNMLHIRESSQIVENISSFIISWQRGELFDVDARRKQYQALYGFPLLAARAWGNISTVDPRAPFIGAFHGFLYEASRYFDSQRNLQMVPDIEAARSAIRQLLESLHEGNENLRVRRTSQIRGQSEYCKRLLGGRDTTSPIGKEWSEILTGRPGIADAKDTKLWQIKVDAVASAYGWARPVTKDYTALAESGETILVATRIFGAIASGTTPGNTKVFLSLLQPHVLRYVNAFKSVGGVDLGRERIVAPPAAIMARKIRPPSVPPLKRNWAARTPSDKQSSAA